MGVGLQRFRAIRVVDELDDGKLEYVATTQNLEATVIGAPSFIFVGQHEKAGDGAGVAVEEPIVVREHAPSKPAVASSLDLDVNVDPALFASFEGNLHQGIGETLAEFGVAYHLAQFGVLEFMAFCQSIWTCASGNRRP